MTINQTHYDIVIIGTGAGGGTLLHRLAPSGKKILILEQGTYLPREKENWSATEVYGKERYHTHDQWIDKEGKAFRPQMSYWVGGNTKVYGAALLRLRERDFEAVQHRDGISPEWPLKYADFEPYYSQAEALFDVHGEDGNDPTAPPRQTPYPYPAVSHEPRMQEIYDGLQGQGLKPFHLPVGLKLNETERALWDCIRCDSCDGFPCLVRGKADSEVNTVRPVLTYPNVTLKTEAKVLRLLTNESGSEVTAVETQIGGETVLFSGDVVVVSCGAANSAALLLRSASDRHPNGLANSSDQVGRNFMKHLTTAMVALNAKKNESVYQKTIAVSDFYWGEDGYDYPMGFIQNTGNVLPDMMPAEAPGLLASLLKIAPKLDVDLGPQYQTAAQHSVGWWFQTEDLPDPSNRVRVVNDQIHLDYTPNNTESTQRLIHRWIDILKAADRADHVIPFNLYPRSSSPIQVLGHQCGTCRFGEDPATSVLDLNCRTHDVDNLYVVDSSFFCSSAAVNPTLTIIANALRVGDHLLERLG
ncbi:GMC oxidoreductase [Synechococcus elongatus]|uniref:GMC family oxidoreductase n=1 Tax=Synechococcus elongatus PCC 11802 TaxID=2283154 RepID=A0AAT9JZ69_SYNEL|nr:GMC family oxidoreductase [Synechococcus elongatus]QFZ92693.1 GMC family oxidoreductase [Synechococcus elongatus PCC 11802]